MAKIDVVGRIENPEEQRREPIVVPIAGYQDDGTEVIEEFRFRSSMPAGAALRAMTALDTGGVLEAAGVARFLRKSLIEDDQDRFLEFLDRDDLAIDASILVKVYEAVAEEWFGRPTRSGGDSSATGSPTSTTSTVARSSNGSSSKTSR